MTKPVRAPMATNTGHGSLGEGVDLVEIVGMTVFGSSDGTEGSALRH